MTLLAADGDAVPDGEGRERAVADLGALLDRWREARDGGDPLAAVDWWGPALQAASAPRAVDEGGLEEVAADPDDDGYRMAIWVPPDRAADPAPLPAVVVFLEFSMDPYATLRQHYGSLLESRLFVLPLLLHPRNAGRDRALSDPDALPRALRLLAARHALDRDRVAVDGHGRGAALATVAAARHAALLQTAIHRMPWERPPLAANLGLLTHLVLTTPAPDGAVGDVLASIRERAWETEHAEAEDFPLSFVSLAPRVQRWLAAPGARRIRDQREEYRWVGPAVEGAERWGRWFVVDEVSTPGEGRLCAVRIRKDRGQNAVVLETENVVAFRLLLNDGLLDLDRPVAVSVNGVWVTPVSPVRDIAAVLRWARRDPGLFVASEVAIRVPEHARGR